MIHPQRKTSVQPRAVQSCPYRAEASLDLFECHCRTSPAEIREGLGREQINVEIFSSPGFCQVLSPRESEINETEGPAR